MITTTTPKKKRPKGTLITEWRDGKKLHFARVRLANGVRLKEPLPPGLSDGKAHEYAGWMQEQEKKEGRLLARELGKERAQRVSAALAKGESPETCNEWFGRFNRSRDAKVGSSEQDALRWKKWIAPVIGAHLITTISSKEIRGVVQKLDAAIDVGEIEPKTALNVWSVLTTAFKESVSSKRDDLRVRSENPCTAVRPPEKASHEKKKSFLYPLEMRRLLACEVVPLVDRELYALAAYLYLRPGELHELRVGDVDFVAGIVNVSRAWDWRARKAKTPKTSEGSRPVPIHQSILPLLRRMCEGKGASDHVVPLLSTLNDNKLAGRFRAHLAKAGIDRSILFERSATRLQVNFRSLRDTGITWLALAKVDTIAIQRRAGHESAETTLGYIKAAEVFGIDIGTPFPTLPSSLIGDDLGPKHGPGEGGINQLDGYAATSDRVQVPQLPETASGLELQAFSTPSSGTCKISERFVFGLVLGETLGDCPPSTSSGGSPGNMAPLSFGRSDRQDLPPEEHFPRLDATLPPSATRSRRGVRY